MRGRGLWQRAGRLVEAHPLTADLALAVGLAGVSVLQGWGDPEAAWRPFDLTATALTVLTTLPNALRRRAPMLVLGVCTAAWTVYAALGYFPGTNTYGVLLAFYTVAASYQGWRVLICGAGLGLVWVASGVAAGQASAATVVAQAVVVPAVLWKVADGSRRLQESHRRLAEVSHTLARRAVVEDRLRIARELHDVVAHHMSVVAVQAGLARYVLRADPDTADAALGTVLDTSGEALDELRRVLELLRLGAEGAEGKTVPGLAYLPDLVERVRGAGVPVEVEITGTPRPLPSGVELCAYRVVQEGLTNVLRHAAPASARVVLHYSDAMLSVTVTDDGTRPASDRAPGKGLTGMRERAMLYGGTVETGPRPGGGFAVRLELPL